MTDKRIVLSTAGSEEEARKIAHHLVEGKLAGCVNIVPQVESIYRWQGKVESAREWLLIIKTTAEQFEKVRDAIRKLHSYDLPECIAVAIEDGSPEYLNWIANSVGQFTYRRMHSSAANPKSHRGARTHSSGEQRHKPARRDRCHWQGGRGVRRSTISP